jgi:hypothetical protein
MVPLRSPTNELLDTAWLTVHPAIRLGTKLNPYGANSLITPCLDVGIRLEIGELELYIFNTTRLDVLELDLGI